MTRVGVVHCIEDTDSTISRIESIKSVHKENPLDKVFIPSLNRFGRAIGDVLVQDSSFTGSKIETIPKAHSTIAEMQHVIKLLKQPAENFELICTTYPDKINDIEKAIEIEYGSPQTHIEIQALLGDGGNPNLRYRQSGIYSQLKDMSLKIPGPQGISISHQLMYFINYIISRKGKKFIDDVNPIYEHFGIQPPNH